MKPSPLFSPCALFPQDPTQPFSPPHTMNYSDDELAIIAACSAAEITVLFYHEKSGVKKKKKRKPQPRFLRAALLPNIPNSSPTPWQMLFNCGTAKDFIIALNFTKDVIVNHILPPFEYERARTNYGSPYRKGPKHRGRQLHVSSLDLIGLCLWYLKTSGKQYELAPVFCKIQSSLGVWIDYALEVMFKVVTDHRRKPFEIRWPTLDEMRASADLLKRNRKHGLLLEGVFGVVDGGRLPCAEFTDPDLQNAYYDGYTLSVGVSNLFVFNFFGELILAAVNFPGSWHDSKIAYSSGLMTEKLSDAKTPRGMCILGDSAFVKEANGKIIRARKSNEVHEIPSSSLLAAIDTILERVMPSERQTAEWGIRAVKAPFGRLRIPHDTDALKRERLLRICVHLLNLRTRYVGLNQIRSVYCDPDYEVDPWLKPFLDTNN